MQTKKTLPSLALVDVREDLDPALLARVRLVVRARRNRCRDGLVLHDWRQTAERFVLRIFPAAWVYRGGRHVAIHASPPPAGGGAAGRELFRIVEINSAADERGELRGSGTREA